MFNFKLLSPLFKNFFYALLGVLIFITFFLFSFFIWYEIGDVSLSLHGWIAISVGSLFMLLVGVSLMALSFYSHRSGHDEEAYKKSNLDD